jgi:2-polyprenyl-3-methyl-5-hydroxy-6-metoxy-1,4-benzoquinol methylase
VEGPLMPSSYIDSLPPIVHSIIDLAPRRIVDVGPGCGKYGLMCREYLPEIDWLDAVEVREGRRALQDVIYDHVFERDARLFSGWPAYDLILLIDVIEHMSKEDGHALLSSMLADGAAVLVSTPKTFFEQHAIHNPYEDHLSLWAWPDFDRYVIKADVSTVDSIIYVLR